MDLTLPFRNVPNGRDLERVPATFRTATIYRSWQPVAAHSAPEVTRTLERSERWRPERVPGTFRMGEGARVALALASCGALPWASSLGEYVVTEVRRSPKNPVETQRGRALAPIPLAQPGLTHCPAHTRPQWFPSRIAEERGFQIARRSYFPLGRRAPRSNTALYPRAMLSLRCAVRQQPNTIPL